MRIHNKHEKLLFCKNNFIKLSKLIGVTAMLQLPAVFANDNPNDYDFTTIITAPENTKVSTVKAIFNSLTNLVFYSGLENEHNQSGFYKISSNENSWSQFKLPITIDYSDNDNYGIIDATDGPYTNTLVLSYKSNEKGTSQYLSNTGDGGLWHSQKINILNNFTNVISTKVYGLQHFVVYGDNHQSALVSMDGNIWGHQLLPNTCITNEGCTFNNKHFASVHNGYLLLQAKITELPDENTENDQSDSQSMSSTETIENQLLFSPNFATWYNVEIPFKGNTVNAVFNTDKNGLLASVTNKEDGTHKLWFTADYKEWNSFDLPSESKLLDAKTGYKNYITLSLGQNNTSDIVILDPDTKSQHLFTSFDGEVTGMSWYNDSLYLSGRFVNFADNTQALLVNMKKKLSDETNTEENPEDNTSESPENSESETIIDVNYLKQFNS